MLSDETEVLDVSSGERSDGFPHGEGNVRPVEGLTGGFGGSQSRNETVTRRVFVIVPGHVSPRYVVWSSVFFSKVGSSLDDVQPLLGTWQDRGTEERNDECRKTYINDPRLFSNRLSASRSI